MKVVLNQTHYTQGNTWIAKPNRLLCKKLILFSNNMLMNICQIKIWCVDDAKCIVVTRVCVSVPRRIPTLLHGLWCNWGMVRVPPSCALLGGFAIDARHSANAKCQRVLCARSMLGLLQLSYTYSRCAWTPRCTHECLPSVDSRKPKWKLKINIT